MILDLFGKVFAMLGIGEIQAVFVDDHRLQANPLLPRLPGNASENPFAQCTRIRRKIQALRQAAELDAIDHSCHKNRLL